MAFPLLEFVQRLVVAPWARRHGAPDPAVLTRWQAAVADFTLGLVGRIGGARFRSFPRIPGRAGTLVVMNHQSLLDIPLVIKSTMERYPRIVTRQRYAKGVPLVSHMLALYRHPLVEPGLMTEEKVAELAETARASEHPIVIFPEGTRTRDGRIGRFQRAGLRAMLQARDWEVWVVVGDGMWQCARLWDFVRGIDSVEVRMLADGPLRFSPREDDADAFIGELRNRMISGLGRLRDGSAPS